MLALGYRDMGRLSLREASGLKREDVEKNLSFVGFIAISCPLKRHTKECVRELQDSSHHVCHNDVIYHLVYIYIFR